LPAALREEAQTAVEAIVAKPPTLATAKPHAAHVDLETPHYILGIDAKTGAIRRLRNKKSKREWASGDHPLALFSYQTLSQIDYGRFFNAYVVSQEDWAKKDFGKPNIEKFGAVSQEWTPTLMDLQAEEDEHGHRMVAQLHIDDAEALRSGRAAFPRKLMLEIVLPNAAPVVEVNFSWFEKPATRMPEALWLTFQPMAPDAKGWMLEKTGEWVSPMDVVVSGNRHMHALSKGFRYKDEGGEFTVDTLDAPLVAIGTKSPLPFSNAQPDPAAGIHCNLFNNAWGTNYIMWFGEDMRFRYLVRG